MDPIDYEDFISSNRDAISQDVMSNLLEFPLDDIQKIEIPKQFSTVDLSNPEIE